MNRFAIAIFATLAGTSQVHAGGASPDPMPTSESIRFGADTEFSQFQAVSSAVYTFAHALDTRDWPLMRTVFADEISVDTSGAGRGHAGNVVKAESFIWDVKISETGFEGTLLLFGNPQVAVEGDVAYFRAAFYGEHTAAVADGENFYTIGGYQDWRLRRIGGHWKIDGFRLRPTWSKGNRDIMRVGVERGAQRLEERGDPPPAGLREKFRW
ncbi:MAG: nuclear transport factor 2 family protein [Gammaproteobacteria bacterium]